MSICRTHRRIASDVLNRMRTHFRTTAKISSHVSSTAGTKDALGTKVDVRWRCRSDSHSGWLRQYLVWRGPLSISIE